MANKTKVNFEAERVLLESGDQTIDLKLSNSIDTQLSVKNAFDKKLELKLKKAQEGINWISLEPTKAANIVT